MVLPLVSDGGPGGMLVMEYRNPAAGERHALRTYLAPFAPLPVGPDNDHLYNVSGPTAPLETSILETFRHLGARWAVYYDAAWQLHLMGLCINVAGVLTELDVVPHADPISGALSPAPPPFPMFKRIFRLRSPKDAVHRIFLCQVGGEHVDVGRPVSPSGGGLDQRDVDLITYLTGPLSAVRSRSGEQYNAQASVLSWWARPLESPAEMGPQGEQGDPGEPGPVGPEGPPGITPDVQDQFLGPTPPPDPQDGWLWMDSSAGAPYPTRVWDSTALPEVEGLQDTGFETPTLADGAFAYNPAGSPWTFDSRTGVSANGSGFTGANDAAPEGRQVGLIQYSGVMAQPFTVPVAMTVVLTLAASSRGGYPAEQVIHVLIDGVQVASLAITNTPHYQDYNTPPIALAAGAHTLSLAGTQASDRTAFIDHLRLRGTTPGAWVLVTGGDAGPPGTPGTPGPAGAGSSGVDADGHALTDCITFPHGQEVCGDVEGILRLLLGGVEQQADQSGYQIPHGHRLEYYAPGAPPDTPAITLPDPGFESGDHWATTVWPTPSPGGAGRVQDGDPLLTGVHPTEGSWVGYARNEASLTTAFTCPQSGWWVVQFDCILVRDHPLVDFGSAYVFASIDGVRVLQASTAGGWGRAGASRFGWIGHPRGPFLPGFHMEKGVHTLTLHTSVFPNSTPVDYSYYNADATVCYDNVAFVWQAPTDAERVRVVHASHGPQIEWPFPQASDTPTSLLGRDPNTGLPVWTNGTLLPGTTPVPVDDAGYGPAPPADARCGAATKMTDRLVRTYEAFSGAVKAAISVVGSSVVAAVLDFALDALTGGAISVLLVPNYILLRQILTQVLGAVVGGLLGPLDEEATAAIRSAAFQALPATGSTVVVTSDVIDAWGVNMGQHGSDFTGAQDVVCQALTHALSTEAWRTEAYAGVLQPTSGCT